MKTYVVNPGIRFSISDLKGFFAAWRHDRIETYEETEVSQDYPFPEDGKITFRRKGLYYTYKAQDLTIIN